MRVDEPIRFRMYGTGMSELADYINQLRVERLMAKAREFMVMSGDKRNWTINHGQCLRIAEALEVRARRIKEKYTGIQIGVDVGTGKDYTCIRMPNEKA